MRACYLPGTTGRRPCSPDTPVSSFSSPGLHGQTPRQRSVRPSSSSRKNHYSRFKYVKLEVQTSDSSKLHDHPLRDPCTTDRMQSCGSPRGFQIIHPPWLVSQRRDPEAVAQALLGTVDVLIRDGCVRCHAVIPKAHDALFPSDRDPEVLAVLDVLFLLVNPDL